MADQSLLEKLKKQIEFYFSDSNFPKDKFLRAKAALNEEGYVELGVIATFKKMQELTTDLELVKEAARNSEHLKLNSDETLIKRIAPLPEEDTSGPRTIYAKGFPHLTGFTTEDVEGVFAKFGKVLCVRLRKTIEKKLKPSAFVEFSTEAEAKAAVEAKPKFKDTDLLVLKKADYFQTKKETRRQKIQAKKAKRKAETGEDNKEETKEGAPKKQKKEKEEPKITGTIMSLKGFGDNMTRETIKELLSEYGTIAFIDFSTGNHDGYLRWDTGETAKAALEKLQAAKKELGGKVPEYALLGAEEEKAYWDKVAASKRGQKPQRGKGRGRGKGRRRY